MFPLLISVVVCLFRNIIPLSLPPLVDSLVHSQLAKSQNHGHLLPHFVQRSDDKVGGSHTRQWSLGNSLGCTFKMVCEAKHILTENRIRIKHAYNRVFQLIIRTIQR